jgi:hypothetical protein
MAIPTALKKQAFLQANLHAFVRVREVPSTFSEPNGIIPVRAEIVRIFKNDLGLNVGELVEFDLPVVKRSAGDVPLGGAICWYEDMLVLPTMEICLNKRHTKFEIASDLYEVIDEFSTSPTFNFDNRDNLVKPEKQTVPKKWLAWWK